MEGANHASGDMRGTLLDASVHLDFMDEYLLGEDWMEEIPACSSIIPPGSSSSADDLDPSVFSQLPGIQECRISPKELDNQKQIYYGASGLSICSTSIAEPVDLISGNQVYDINVDGFTEFVIQTHEHRDQESSRSLVIGPMESIAGVSSVKERLTRALSFIKESNTEGELLIQIWVPVRSGDRQVLTTCGQPFWLDSRCQRLVDYRAVSTNYHFSAEENSNDALGLPGRVFVGRLPEWTPDVRFFSSYEYPRVNFAQHYDVRGSLALPVFDQGNWSCLGVVEVVMTTEKINYSSDIENICKALQAVDLRSSEVMSVSHVKVKDDSYQAVLPEVSKILRVACELHNLPLAQIWIPCFQQGRRGSRHSTENFRDCISTVDVACYVNDPSVLGFHEACSEHHLLKGQGVAGKAFTINQPCFSSDITSFDRKEYPLSHHARVFNLRGAVAIRLRSVLSRRTDFVLEFFLPIKCVGWEEQKLMLNSLSITIQQVSQNLRVVTAKELNEEIVLHDGASMSGALHGNFVLGAVQRSLGQETLATEISTRTGIPGADLNWSTSVARDQDIDGSRMLNTPVLSKFEGLEVLDFSSEIQWVKQDTALHAELSSSMMMQDRQDSDNTNDQKDLFSTQLSCSKTRKATEKKHAKTDKAISLQVLQQYFTGSLKDAAKDIGVCPTTLKRICRQHGITRWPSRKIKKVSHSLRKLQVVIDSVQGVDKSFQFSSLYENFPKPSKSDLNGQSAPESICSAFKESDQAEASTAPTFSFRAHTSASCSPPSSCSQSSSSSHYCSSGEKQYINASQFAVKEESFMEENYCCMLSRSSSELDLHLLARESKASLARSHSHKSLTLHHSSGIVSPAHQSIRYCDLLGVKVTYGEDKVRFRLQPSWGLQDLKQETAKRFNISDSSSMELKYLDDDSEWVLLTCDADLQECVDVYKSSSNRTIKITVYCIAQPCTVNH